MSDAWSRRSPVGHFHRQALQGGVPGVAGQDPDRPPLGQEFHYHRPAYKAAAAGDQGEGPVFGFRLAVFGGEAVIFWLTIRLMTIKCSAPVPL